MIPGLLSRIISLKPRIFDRHSIRTPDPLLLHGNSVQVSLAPAVWPDRLAQLLTSIVHGRMHSLPLLGSRFVLLAPEELPGAVDRPVAQVPQASHPEGRRRRREHVLPESLYAVEVLRLGGRAVLPHRLGPRRGLFGGHARHGCRGGREEVAGRGGGEAAAREAAAEGEDRGH